MEEHLGSCKWSLCSIFTDRHKSKFDYKTYFSQIKVNLSIRPKYQTANSCHFQWVLLLKNLQQENAVTFKGLPFVSVSTSCTADLISCTGTESNIHVKSCTVHMKSSRKLKNVHIEDFQDYFSLCSAKAIFDPSPRYWQDLSQSNFFTAGCKIMQHYMTNLYNIM